MAKCTGITRSGIRCKGIAIDSSGYCHAHHPDRAEQRKRAASRGGRRGGRGRTGPADLREIQRQVKGVIAGVLNGSIDKSVASVVFGGFHCLLRAVDGELRAREQEELTERLEALEAQERTARWGGIA